MASEILAAWLITVALHASVLLGIAWLLDRGALRARPAWRELMWRAAARCASTPVARRSLSTSRCLEKRLPDPASVRNL